MHSYDGDGHMFGTDRSDELLRARNDTIRGRGAADVIWGDYKPCCQPSASATCWTGANGNDHIYASHGRNRIIGGPGRDLIHGHFGRGRIDCGRAATRCICHRSRPGYRLRPMRGNRLPA